MFWSLVVPPHSRHSIQMLPSNITQLDLCLPFTVPCSSRRINEYTLSPFHYFTAISDALHEKPYLLQTLDSIRQHSPIHVKAIRATIETRGTYKCGLGRTPKRGARIYIEIRARRECVLRVVEVPQRNWTIRWGSSGREGDWWVRRAKFPRKDTRVVIFGRLEVRP